MSSNVQRWLAIAVMFIGSLTFSPTHAAPTPITLYMGTWGPSATYSLGQMVTWNNQTWLSLVCRNKNKTPGAAGTAAYWQLLGSNAPGPQGPAGPQGAPGPQGLLGSAGAQPGV